MLAASRLDGVKQIREVILAAPDFGTVEITEQIMPALRRLRAPIALYPSFNDRLLELSRRLYGCTRDCGACAHLVGLNGIETIDASQHRSRAVT